MFKQGIIFFMFIFSFCSVFSATVNVDVDVFSEYSLFSYEFNFSEDDSFRSFSFERPSDSQIDFVKDEFGEAVKYSIAGDYYIINPGSVKNKTYFVRFTSKLTSKEIFEKKSFSTYANFNFILDRLVFNLDLKEYFGDLGEFYPRNYQVLEDESYEWIIDNLEKEELFRVEFSEVKTKEELVLETAILKQRIYYSAIVFVLILVLVGIIYFFNLKYDLLKKKHKDEKESEKKSKEKVDEEKDVRKDIRKDKEEKEIEVIYDDELVVENDESLKDEKNSKNESKYNEEEYSEVFEKFLTENEKLVVSCVREHYGISQYDILNFLPNLSKSNLSKIISKLDNKKILKRIRVGKVNKIYLGSRFDLPKKE